jgi:xanthine dehydrogenase accessory factor
MPLPDTVLAAALRLQQAGTPYALVSVTQALAPASARPGDKAVVTVDGTMVGWVGGGCAQPAVLRTVRQALQDGRARMIRIAPTEGAAAGAGRELGEVLEFGMSCQSGGTLELFVDPVLPRPQLVVIGASPVAQSLAQLGPRVGFELTVVAHEADAAAFPDAHRVIPSDDPATVMAQLGAGAWVVVATQGRRDVQALRLALALQPRQVSFVASARKAEVLKASLVTAGSDPAAVAAIVAPAGYPMAATTPEEIALSVLAAVVSARRGAVPAEAPVSASAPFTAAVPASASASASSGAETADRAGSDTAAPPGSCCGGLAPAATVALDTDPLPAGDATPAPVAPVTAPAGPSSCCGG